MMKMTFLEATWPEASTSTWKRFIKDWRELLEQWPNTIISSTNRIWLGTWMPLGPVSNWNFPFLTKANFLYLKLPQLYTTTRELFGLTHPSLARNKAHWSTIDRKWELCSTKINPYPLVKTRVKTKSQHDLQQKILINCVKSFMDVKL